MSPYGVECTARCVYVDRRTSPLLHCEQITLSIQNINPSHETSESSGPRMTRLNANPVSSAGIGQDLQEELDPDENRSHPVHLVHPVQISELVFLSYLIRARPGRG